MNVEEMLQGARDALTVQRVYGEPIERDGTLIIPAARCAGAGEAAQTIPTTLAAGSG